MTLSLLLVAALLTANPMLTPGDQTRTLTVDGRERSYLVHVPGKYDGKTPTPVVIALHGAALNGPMMAAFSGLNTKADQAGFIVVYPNGTGPLGILLTWNAGSMDPKGRPDDVAFLRKLLDDLGSVAKVDPRRVYATGLSNGGMMCYRLAAELSDRIAAIAAVAGTMAIEKADPKRPVPVLHFHGTADAIVPFDGVHKGTPKFIHFKSVEDSIRTWVKIDGCDEKPEVADLPHHADDMLVERKTYGHGKEGSEVVLVVIQGGGHTWPGQEPPVAFLGKSTKNISANDLIWEFFRKHPMP
jgi:polyhydroxybutyrate depolymerase